MEIIIILIVILIVFYFFNTTNKKKEGFDFWSNINSAFGIGGNRQNQQPVNVNCDDANMYTCNNLNYLLNCPKQCGKINQCQEWAKNDECDKNPDYMKVSMKEGGCKEVCDQNMLRKDAMKALMDSNPMFRNLITTK
jgi:hypothetical protein